MKDNKERFIHFRIDGGLLERFERALKAEGLTKTIFLTNAIHEFVEKVEEKLERMEKKIDGSLAAAKKFVVEAGYPPIGESLFWYGYFTKLAELKREPERRIIYEYDFSKFSFDIVKKIHAHALELMGGKLDSEMEEVARLATQKFAPVEGMEKSHITFYWMAGYTFRV